MLTSLFYYQHYKPYMVANTNESVYARKQRITRALDKKTFSNDGNDLPVTVALNKSLNSHVISYAKGIYKNVTDLKYSSKRLSDDIKNHEKYKRFDEFDEEVFEQHFSKNLDSFTQSYNKSRDFLKSQEHSAYLKDVGEGMEEIMNDGRRVLSALGVDSDEFGEFEAVDPNKVNSFFNKGDTAKKAEEAVELFSKINGEASEVLGNPMAKHMNFKSLSYYYNYKADSVRVDSFQIIKTGLLVNLGL